MSSCCDTTVELGNQHYWELSEGWKLIFTVWLSYIHASYKFIKP